MLFSKGGFVTHLAIWSAGLCLFFACSPQEEKPSLSDEKLAFIMADLNVAEAATIGLSGYPKDSLMNLYFAQVFEIHGTTPEAYEKDLRILSADLPRIHKIVLESIKLLEGGNPAFKKTE